jgi:DNA-binding transcriptional ArsR family regulator
MAFKHPLSDEIVEVVARRFRVLGDPTRIRLLERLQAGEATVQELCEVAGTSQQNVSKHLGVLTDAGIIARRREGSHALYHVVDEGVYRLCEDVCGSLQRRLESLSGALRSAASRR